MRKEGIFSEVRRDWGIKYEETHSDPAWGDADAAGDLDLYLTSIYPGRRSFLYLNALPAGRFTDVTSGSGVSGPALAAVAGDYDNDGRPDLLLVRQDGLALFHAEGELRFSESTVRRRSPRAITPTMGFMKRKTPDRVDSPTWCRAVPSDVGSRS